MDDVELILIKLAEILQEPRAKAAITSTQLAKKMGVSQQTASRHMIKLAKQGLITRATKGRRQEIQFTEKGNQHLEKMSRTLTKFFSTRKQTTLEGVISSGLGEGAYYIRQYEWKILPSLGFRPYPGTLNVKVEGEKPDLSSHATHRIEGFQHSGRHFGALDLIPIQLEVRGHKIECHIALPERTHHKRDFEIISHYNLRSKYNIKDGDKSSIILK